MVESEACPHCFSDQFKIDFETVFARRALLAKGVSTNRTSEQAQEEQKSPTGRARSGSSEDAMHFANTTRMYHKSERREMRATSIARHTKSV